MQINIVIPVYNEELILKKNIGMILDFLNKNNLIKQVRIIIVDNASTDKTSIIGQSLAANIPEIIYFRLSEKGKGRAIRTAWEKFPAEILGFMDADLATDLKALPACLEAISSGADIVYGSRWLQESRVERSFLRTACSFGYRLCLLFFFGFSDDSHCGFKFINKRVAKTILPLVNDNNFFFDTELLMTAKAHNFQLSPISVNWVENRNPHRTSSVNIWSTARYYLHNLWSLKKRLNTLDSKIRK